MTEKEKLIHLCMNNCGCALNDVFDQCGTLLFYTSWYEERLFTKEKRRGSRNDNEKTVCSQLTSMIDISIFDQYGDVFVSRYISDSLEATTEFANLHLPRSIRDEVKTALVEFAEGTRHPDNLLWSYMQIVYQFRNNMFHGNKGLANLKNFETQFNLINAFMHKLMCEIIRWDYHGLRNHT